MIQPEILSVDAIKEIAILLEEKNISLSPDVKLAISEIISSIIKTAQKDARLDTINKQINDLITLKESI